MLTLTNEPTDAEILALVEAWVRVLRDGDYARALVLVASRPHWTPSLLARVVTNYGDASAAETGPHRVTDPDTATGDPTREVDRFGNGHVQVWYDLPLDGAWSDLTATLDVKEGEGGAYLELVDVHVM